MDEKDYYIEDISTTSAIVGIPDTSGYAGMIPQFDDGYKPLNIDATQLELNKKASELVQDVISVYYKIDDNDSDIVNYLNGYSQIETMTLQNLLLQVKASEHVLMSLLSRLNATGSVDNGLYKLINETQERCISLTLQVSSYVRSLPTYFKQLRFELETNIEMIHVTQTQEMLEQKEQENDDDFVKRPQKGMRSFLKQLEEIESSMDIEYETINEIPNKNGENNEDEQKLIDDLRKQLIDENS